MTEDVSSEEGVPGLPDGAEDLLSEFYGDNEQEAPPEVVSRVFQVIEQSVVDAMGDTNQLVITLTDVTQKGKPVWQVTAKGMTFITDSFEQLIMSLNRLH